MRSRWSATAPPAALAVGAVLSISGNLYDIEPLGLLDAIGFMALALGFAASSYTWTKAKTALWLLDQIEDGISPPEPVYELDGNTATVGR